MLTPGASTLPSWENGQNVPLSPTRAEVAITSGYAAGFNASTGAQLNLNQLITGAGTCSIGGSLADAINEGGFTWENSCFEFVVATAFFPGDGSTLSADRVIEISNMSLSVCTAESEQPELTCPNEGPNLFVNPGFDSGDLTGWNIFGFGGIEGNVGDPLPSAFLFQNTGGIY